MITYLTSSTRKLQHFSVSHSSSTSSPGAPDQQNTYGWYAFNLAKFSSSAADCFTNGVVSLGAMVMRRVEEGKQLCTSPPVCLCPHQNQRYRDHQKIFFLFLAIQLPAQKSQEEGDCGNSKREEIRFPIRFSRSTNFDDVEAKTTGVRDERGDSFRWKTRDSHPT